LGFVSAAFPNCNRAGVHAQKKKKNFCSFSCWPVAPDNGAGAFYGADWLSVKVVFEGNVGMRLSFPPLQM
jgi:hypothetical protein